MLFLLCNYSQSDSLPVVLYILFSETIVPFQDAFDEVVKFFGENSKTMPPSVFFPVFVRFVKTYRVKSAVRHLLNIQHRNQMQYVTQKSCTSLFQQAEEENEQRKRQEQILMEKLLEQEAMEQENQKVKHAVCVFTYAMFVFS